MMKRDLKKRQSDEVRGILMVYVGWLKVKEKESGVFTS